MKERTPRSAAWWTRRRWLPGERRLPTGAATEPTAVLTPVTRTPKRGKETEQ
ncbi:hypothetical protein GCM10027444_03640 [Actinopolyspora lacussalsi]